MIIRGPASFGLKNDGFLVPVSLRYTWRTCLLYLDRRRCQFHTYRHTEQSLWPTNYPSSTSRNLLRSPEFWLNLYRKDPVSENSRVPVLERTQGHREIPLCNYQLNGGYYSGWTAGKIINWQISLNQAVELQSLHTHAAIATLQYTKFMLIESSTCYISA